MFLRPTLTATALTLLFTGPLAAQEAPTTLPEGFAALAAEHGLTFDVAAGTLSPGGTITAYELELEGGRHTLRFGDCDDAGCDTISITSILPNTAGLDGRTLAKELESGNLAAFSTAPVRRHIAVRAENVRVEITFIHSEADALAKSIGEWRLGILELAERLATPRPDPTESQLAVFSPDALAKTLSALGATMEPDTEGGARLPEDEKSFLVTSQDFSYLATFTGCRSEGCTGLTLQAAVANRGRLTGARFNEIYDGGRFAFISDSALRYSVQANLRVVTLTTEVWPEMADDPERLQANLAILHRYITELSAALAEAPPAPDPLEQTVRSPEDVARLIRALGWSAATVRSERGHVIKVPTPNAPILIYYAGCKSEKQPGDCLFLLLETSLRLRESPGAEAIARYSERSFCCKAYWSADDKRLIHAMALPLRPGINAALIEEALLIFRSQEPHFLEAFAETE